MRVTVAAIRHEGSRLDNPWVDAGDWQEAPAAVVVNGGHYTITGIETRFCCPVSGQVAGHRTAERVSSMATLPAPLAEGLSRLASDLESSVLTPADVGVRFYGEFADPGEEAGGLPGGSAGPISGHRLGAPARPGAPDPGRGALAVLTGRVTPPAS